MATPTLGRGGQWPHKNPPLQVRGGSPQVLSESMVSNSTGIAGKAWGLHFTWDAIAKLILAFGGFLGGHNALLGFLRTARDF